MGIIDDLIDLLTGRYKKLIDIGGGKGIYHVFEIDLSIERIDKKYTFKGDQLLVQRIDSQAYLKLNTYENPYINLNLIRSIDSPYKEFYITNSAGSGHLHILCGSEGMFKANQNYNVPLTDALGNVINISLDELATRISTLYSGDRRGNVIWNDDFEATTINWSTNAVGIGSSVALDTDYRWRGEQSLKLVTGSGDGNWSSITKKFPIPSTSKIGAEIYARLPDEDTMLRMEFYGYDGTKLFVADLVFYPKTRDFYIRKDAGSDLLIASGVDVPTQDKEVWIMFKLVIDWKTKKYVRAVIGSNEYDLSSYNIYSEANATPPNVELYIALYTNEGVNHTCYLDNFILTQNEV